MVRAHAQDLQFGGPEVKSRFDLYRAGFALSSPKLKILDHACNWFASAKLGSLRSRRLEIVGARKNGRARERETRGENELAPSLLACLPLARPFFLEPTTCKRLLGRLPVGILNPVKFNLNYLLQAFARPH